MQARTLARHLALDVLYESEIRGILPLDAFVVRGTEGWVDDAASDVAPTMPPEDVVAYARDLVTGVQSHHAEIDELIAGYADRWTIERMPIIDRNVIRIALFELLWGDDIPVAVAINEAVELAKELSTDDSGRFVNGLLGRIVETRGPRPA